MTRHLASVDLRPNGEYFISTYSFDGRLGVSDGPPVVLSPTPTAERLGTETLAALRRSTTIDSPFRAGGTAPDQDLLERAGVKTYGAYMKGTKSIEVFAEFDGDFPNELELTPFDNLGARGGYEPIIAKTVIAAYSTDEELGALISAVLNDATTESGRRSKHR